MIKSFIYIMTKIVFCFFFSLIINLYLILNWDFHRRGLTLINFRFLGFFLLAFTRFGSIRIPDSLFWWGILRTWRRIFLLLILIILFIIIIQFFILLIFFSWFIYLVLIKCNSIYFFLKKCLLILNFSFFK